MAYEDVYWEINKEITELKLQKKFDAQLEKMKWQDHHKFHDTRDQWEYAKNKVVKEYYEKKAKKASK